MTGGELKKNVPARRADARLEIEEVNYVVQRNKYCYVYLNWGISLMVKQGH